jgi:DNA-binding response OmpR family regulator
MRSRILVIESEPNLTNKLVSIFTAVGFATAVASDYSEALMQMERFNPDMVIMESVLPDKDGFEVCSEFHNRFHVPVILLGQDLSDRAWERVMESGADHYEVKPYRYLSLVARMKAILRYRPVA